MNTAVVEYRSICLFHIVFRWLAFGYRRTNMEGFNRKEGQHMNMNTTIPQSNHLKDQLREMMEPTAEASKEAFQAVGTATNEAAGAMQNSFSTALKGIQEYNSKIVEFAAANAQSHMEFVQRLAGVKSPFDFVEICHDHSRQQLETLTEQAKELAKLSQDIAGSATEPLIKGVEKATEPLKKGVGKATRARSY